MAKSDFLAQKRQREFEQRVMAAVEKPKESRLWALLNKPFTLWILSLFLISVFGSYISAYQQCRKDAEDEIERATKISRELFQRETTIQKIILTKSNVNEMTQELAKPDSYYPEFSGLQIEALLETYASFLNRVLDLKSTPVTKEEERFLQFYSVSMGYIPANLTDKDIPALREYASKMLAKTWPIPLPGFGVSPFEAACGPTNLYDRLLKGNSARIVRDSDRLTTPRIFPLPNPEATLMPRT